MINTFKNITIGVYTKEHLNIIGGGAVHGGKFIEFLSEYYDIEILGQAFNKQLLKDKHDINLDNVEYKNYQEGDEDKYDIFLNICHWEIKRSRAYKRFALIFFPKSDYNRNGYHLLANSQYTADNIKRLWTIKDYDGVSVIYPPVRVKEVSKIKKPKLNQIIHCSRINRPNIDCDKGHETMIRAFKRLNNSNWQFNLVGQVQDDTYYNNLLAMANACNNTIKFHLSVNKNELWNLYAQSKIYWHMTGISFLNNPSAQEHFGMTTVEAMAAGCVPIVHGTGGQREIIEDKVDGFFVYNEDELIEKTEYLIKNPKILEKMSKKAKIKALKFSEEKSKQKLFNIVSRTNTVSIIVLAHNNYELTKKCLDSLIKYTPSGYELILVNNFSTDKTSQLFLDTAKKYSNTKIINTNKNLSYAQANNLGVKQASNNYILFLNNDTELKSNIIPRMINSLDDEKIGIVGARMYFPPERAKYINFEPVIQHAGVDFKPNGDSYHIGHWKQDSSVRMADNEEVKAVTGACMLVRKELAKFSEKYEFGYYEDTHLCLKARKKGYKIILNHNAKLFHHEGATQVKIPEIQRQKYSEKNKQLFIKTWLNSGLL